MTGKLHATRPYVSGYVVHAQILQGGVRVMSGDGIECQILDVT